MKVAGAKRDVFPGSSVSTGAKFPVAPVDSAPMHYTAHCTRWCIKNAVTNFLHQLLDRRLCFHQHFVCLFVTRITQKLDRIFTKYGGKVTHGAKEEKF